MAERGLFGKRRVVGCRRTFRDFGLWTLDFGPLCIAGLGPERKQEEKRAQHILAFSHPSYGFDVGWVQAEPEGHQGAGPAGASKPAKQPEQQEGVRQVQQETDQVVAPWTKSKELTV